MILCTCGWGRRARGVGTLQASRDDEVRRILAALVRQGCNLDTLALLCLVMGRNVAKALTTEYPSLTVITCALDECVAGRLLPGCGNFEQRCM